jgi:hypothetical protein
MTKFFSTTAVAAAMLAAGTMSASATLIDFTTSPAPLNGTVTWGGNYSLAGFNSDGSPATITESLDIPQFCSAPPCLTYGDGTTLDGTNDGLGIKTDELTGVTPPEYITVTFDNVVRLTGMYFFDAYSNGEQPNDSKYEVEIGNVSVGGTLSTPPVADGSAVGFQDPTFNSLRGLAYNDSLDLIGDTFTFWADNTNDDVAAPDVALAALRIAPVPLPASALLLLGAVGGLAAVRRKKTA